MIKTTSTLEAAPSSLAPADPAWSCRWCRSDNGVRVLDAGYQSPSDLHPLPSDPEPDPGIPARYGDVPGLPASPAVKVTRRRQRSPAA
jgi:hypothetical protein